MSKITGAQAGALPDLPAKYSVRRYNENIYTIKGRHGVQAIGKALARKQHPCANCRRAITKGDWCYRPLTNGLNRADRLCVGCVEGVDPIN